MGEVTAGERGKIDDVDEWTHDGVMAARDRPEHDVKLLTRGSFLVVSLHAESRSSS